MAAALAQRQPRLDGAAVLAAWKPLFAAAPWDVMHQVRGCGIGYRTPWDVTHQVRGCGLNPPATQRGPIAALGRMCVQSSECRV